VRFTYTGGKQKYTVPSGVTELQIDACGAAGNGLSLSSGTWTNGGFVRAKIPTWGGATYFIYMGQAGMSVTDPKSRAFNGGGVGEVGLSANNNNYHGGGATDIRAGDGGDDGSALLTSRLVVAGGGGSGGWFTPGGPGGGLVGGSGSTGYGSSDAGSVGTQTRPGFTSTGKCPVREMHQKY